MGNHPEKVWLFRMLHWQNVEYVLQNGICCREHVSADPNYINIGMRSLIQDRHEHPIPLGNAGKLGDYVPFYFAGHSPMLYLIMNGYSGVEQKPQKDIVYILSNYEAIKEAGLSFVFTDRNAKIAVANFYNKEEDLDCLNWEVIRSKNWSNDANNFERQDLKQAEFMVRNHVPVSCIYALVVKTEERKVYFDEIITKLGLSIKVIVDINRKLYY